MAVVIVTFVNILDTTQTPKGTNNKSSSLCGRCGDHTSLLFFETSLGVNHDKQLHGVRGYLLPVQTFLFMSDGMTQSLLKESSRKMGNEPYSLSAGPPTIRTS